VVNNNPIYVLEYSLE